VLCSKCATNLPEGSQFCLKCGATTGPPVRQTELPIMDASLGCSKCGAELPPEAQFCLQCGKPVSSPPKRPVASAPRVEVPPSPAAPPRNKRHLVLWILLAALLAAIVWAVSSDNPFAQGIQELVGWKHDQAVLDTPFTIGPHTFRYYKFALPPGSVNVSIIGQFSAASEKRNAGGAKEGAKEKSEDQDKDSSGIEVYVLSEPAFTVWQNGYATSSLYESGRVVEGKLNQELPAGAGIYYLVFSNKFSPKTPKSVHASVLLRYKSWLPESLRRGADRFWNWLGV
jgi:ribosomal protein L40E